MSTAGSTESTERPCDDVAAEEPMDDRPVPAAAADYSYNDLGVCSVDFSVQQPDRGADGTEASSEIDISHLSVGERLYYIGCGMERNRQERLREEREKAALAELSQLTAKPMITSRARQLPSRGTAFADQSMEWRRRLEHFKRQQRSLQASEEAMETCLHPSVTRRSESIIRGLGGRYHGPISGWNRHFARYQTKKNMLPEQEVFSPSINLSAVMLQRDRRPVGERLHEEAAAREERLRAQSEVSALREMVDPVTSQPLFTPNRGCSRSRTPQGRRSTTPPARGGAVRRSVSTSARRDADAVVNSLLSRGQESLKRKEQRREESQRKKHPFRPNLCSRSKDMATLCRKPLYEVPQLPDTKPTAPRRSASPARGDVRPLHGSDDFLRRNDKLLATRRERVQQLKVELADRETADCTFAPRICSRSDDILSSTPSQVARRARSAASSPAPPLPPPPPPPPYAPALSPPRPPSYEPYDRPRPPSYEAARAAPEPSRAPPEGTAQLKQFEAEMLGVLDEWRRLEEM
eukprot:TRINITY_DN1151_c2_g1_i1.p1 TRINITY_DN1151_c2_g1~~TRINITY_DN1151_c2_g1_i1.p1  ORF type:complete len:536 (+),score=136.96 TRINITY_DN1151_c2_g1_i1:43-1608(+)